MTEKITVSSQIRSLARAGMTKAEIAKTLNIRYQHVRNVLLADQARVVANMEQLTFKF